MALADRVVCPQHSAQISEYLFATIVTCRKGGGKPGFLFRPRESLGCKPVQPSSYANVATGRFKGDEYSKAFRW